MIAVLKSDEAKREKFDDVGHIWLRKALSTDEIQELRSLCGGAGLNSRVSAQSKLFVAIQNGSLSKQIARLWPGMKPRRVVIFNKSTGMNWSVPWHQDRVIAVREKVELEGVSNWSKKGDIWHCEPPFSVLEQMLFVRVHLDASTVDNGAMEIAPGSHHDGIIPASIADARAKDFTTVTTSATPGDVLIMKMLTLHRSSPAQSDTGRLTLRVDFAANVLPNGLSWS